MSNLRQAAEQALEYLENNSSETDALVQVEPHVWEYKRSLVIQALRQALAHPDLARVGEVGVWGDEMAKGEHEPVAWANSSDLQNFDMRVRTNRDHYHTVPLYTPRPKREWIGLTFDEMAQLYCDWRTWDGFARAIEAKLKEKNGG